MSSSSKNELGDELRAYRRLGDVTPTVSLVGEARPVKLGQFVMARLRRRRRRAAGGEGGEGGGKGEMWERNGSLGVSLPLTRPEANWPESRVAFPSSGSGIMADLHVSRQANSRPSGWSNEHEELLSSVLFFPFHANSYQFPRLLCKRCSVKYDRCHDALRSIDLKKVGGKYFSLITVRSLFWLFRRSQMD